MDYLKLLGIPRISSEFPRAMESLEVLRKFARNPSDIFQKLNKIFLNLLGLFRTSSEFFSIDNRSEETELMRILINSSEFFKVLRNYSDFFVIPHNSSLELLEVFESSRFSSECLSLFRNSWEYFGLYSDVVEWLIFEFCVDLWLSYSSGNQ